MVETKTLMTADDLWRLQDSKHRYELVRGELIEMTPPGGVHASIARKLGARLGDYADAHGLGETLIEGGFCLECQPDTVRGPDVSFLSAENVPAGGLPEGFIQGAPDLAVEIVSPNDSAAELEAKVQDYLMHGTRLVWVIYPKTRTVIVHRPDGSAQMLGHHDELSCKDLVPGFTLRVGDLFGS